jgi:hypothetical protein
MKKLIKKKMYKNKIAQEVKNKIKKIVEEETDTDSEDVSSSEEEIIVKKKHFPKKTNDIVPQQKIKPSLKVEFF